MRHRVAGKQLSRTTSHRKALRRNMAASLIQHGAIRTTEAKAKELRRFIERIITIARKGTLHARRRVLSALGDRAMTDDEGKFLEKTIVQKLFDEIGPRYVDRPGGYTRIIRLDERRIGDASTQVIIQLVEESDGSGSGDAQKSSRRKRRAAKRHEAAASPRQSTQEVTTEESDSAEPQAQSAEEEAPGEEEEGEGEADEGSENENDKSGQE